MPAFCRQPLGLTPSHGLGEGLCGLLLLASEQVAIELDGPRPWLGHHPLDVYGIKRQPTGVPSIPFYFRFLLVSTRGFPGANSGVLGIDASARFARGSIARMRSTTPRWARSFCIWFKR